MASTLVCVARSVSYSTMLGGDIQEGREGGKKIDGDMRERDVEIGLNLKCQSCNRHGQYSCLRCKVCFLICLELGGETRN